jgi:HAMP domain-containing protein
MTPVTPTTSITIDEKTYEVENMSDEVKQMVQFLDTWRQDESDQASELLKTRAALRDLQNTMLAQINQDNAPKEEVAETETSKEEVFGEPVEE